MESVESELTVVRDLGVDCGKSVASYFRKRALIDTVKKTKPSTNRRRVPSN